MTNRPFLIGVLNVTPDSFSDGGRFTSVDAAVAQAKLLAEQGADILDIGGESTRPGAARVPVATEIERVVPVIEAIRAAAWYPERSPKISIDTMNSQTALAAMQAGAHIINDVSGGLADPAMFAVVAKTSATFVLSHWRGHSTEMDALNQYADVAQDVAAELSERVEAALAAGVREFQIILDPGLGFAKDAQQNWELLGNLEPITSLGYPVLIGASRKRFLAAAINPDDPAAVTNEQRDEATAALTASLLNHKIWGFRVHNVAANLRAIEEAQGLQVASD